MRKNEYSTSAVKKGLSRACLLVLQHGMALITLSLVGIAYLLLSEGTLTYADAAYYGGMIEYALAAIALLTAGAYLLEYVARKGIT